MSDFFTIVLIGMAISVAVFAFGLIQVHFYITGRKPKNSNFKLKKQIKGDKFLAFSKQRIII